VPADVPEPLWQSVVGDKEPWRRGRLFLVGFAVLSALSDLFVCAVFILGGFVEVLLAFVIARAVFWLQFYFIWIGVHWVRWLQGGLSMICGFAFFVWSIPEQSGALMTWGIFSIATGAYLGFAPSVHFFAVRQKEKRNWVESVAIAFVFVLMLLSLASGVLGLLRYKTRLREEALEFANTAFQRVFSDHDTYFLLDHATTRLLMPPYGRAKLTKFLQDVTLRAGDVHAIRPANGFVILRYSFPAALLAEGEMKSEGAGLHGRVLLRMRIGGAAGDWKIDTITWIYPDSVRAR
jgi:hypothetical protein